MSINTIHRFNLYSNQAVFLYECGQKWTKEEYSLFDLDMVNNVVIFDQYPLSDNQSDTHDILNFFQMCNLPFSNNVNLYTLVSENTLEHKLFLRQKRD